MPNIFGVRTMQNIRQSVGEGSGFISEYKDLMFSKEREHTNVVEY